ncbi:indolepyruvate ferredoxin oxidoreductase subunit beta [archaeon]|nr:MAG: indolepyruvate ferredoxin oxidoreductase subunit beta [archaeon]
MGYNIVITGVGGQGVLVASQIIANAAMKNDMKVRVGETHGMAQRGGSVIAHVRFGADVFGSMTPEGEGDVLLAFEPAEALRYLNYMRQGSYAVFNEHPAVPVSVTMGSATYPSLEEIKSALGRHLHAWSIDATALAVRAGNHIATNTVLIGAFARVAKDAGIPLSRDVLLEAVKERVPERYHELNAKAFELGYEAIV